MSGLFHACYQIGESRPGGKLFKLNWWSTRRAGASKASAASLKLSVRVTSSLQGNYSQLPTLPPAPTLLVVLLTGYPREGPSWCNWLLYPHTQ
ncbi:DUF1842 domain-containing protein [Bradyrhizobium sp. USDA 329]|uniref:DUF1842 domain-containing protein n=1 Tax=unclassified Bradyrhizobium TaxID=2631580 RepID=UPI003513E221